MNRIKQAKREEQKRVSATIRRNPFRLARQAKQQPESPLWKKVKLPAPPVLGGTYQCYLTYWLDVQLVASCTMPAVDARCTPTLTPHPITYHGPSNGPPTPPRLALH